MPLASWLSDKWQGKERFPRATATDTPLYNELHNTTTFHSLAKLVRSTTTDELKNYCRVIQNHKWKLYDYQELVDDHKVPCIHLDKLSEVEPIDPAGIYFIEFASNLSSIDQLKHLERFKECKTFIVFIGCDAVTGVIPDSYHQIDGRALIDNFTKSFSTLTNSCIHMALPSTHSSLTLTDIILSENTYLSFSAISILEIQRSTIMNEILCLSSVPLYHLSVRDSPQDTIESLTPLMQRCEVFEVSYYGDKEDSKHRTIEDFNETYEQANKVKPETYEIYDLTLRQPWTTTELHHIHALENITFATSGTYCSFKISTAPKGFFTGSTVERPVIENISALEVTTPLRFSLRAIGLFPQINEWKLESTVLEVEESLIGDSGVFEGFGPDVYGDLFQGVVDLSWKASPSALLRVDGILDQLSKLTLQTRDETEIEVIQGMTLPHLTELTLNSHTDGNIALPEAPELTVLTLIMNDRRESIKLQGLSVKYPKLKILNISSGPGTEDASIPITWEGSGESVLCKVSITNSFTLDKGFFSQIHPSLRQLSASLAQDTFKSIALNTNTFSSLESLTLTLAHPTEQLSLALQDFKLLKTVIISGFTTVKILGSPLLMTLESKAATPLISLEVDPEQPSLMRGSYYTVNGQEIHQGGAQKEKYFKVWMSHKLPNP